jgi:hypothetical protein
MAVSINTFDALTRLYVTHGLAIAPLLSWPEDTPIPSGLSRGAWDWMGRDGPLGQFLDDFGPALVEKYNPKGIVVFSAHWETDKERFGECRYQVHYQGNIAQSGE